ncbi:MAG TPA: tetratricopeptide repeat protein, partial [Longimicrobium sp.]|uniref:tetratricopeptide repeat protein n=1 Tax=Longimicrobium sp. TaxID=2029185 RepID=UPI002EDAE7EE
MSFAPDSILRPLHQRAADVELLRSGAAPAGAVVRVARATETTLRRMLRDDPTAPVELRLRALSEDDLPAPDLLAELRRRNRLPMELAAAVHELDGVAHRIASGADPLPRDGQLAFSVAQGLEAHVRALPAMPLEDPVEDEEEPQLSADSEPIAHEVPASRRRFPWQALAALGVLVLLLVVVVRMRADGRASRGLERAEAAYAQGRIAEAEAGFRAWANAHPRDPQARVYLARIYRETGRRADAQRQLQAGLDAAPDEPGLHVELGYLLLDGRHSAEAVERFRTALRYNPEGVGAQRAWGGLVRALRESGRAAEAEAELRRAPAELRALMRSAPAAPAAA